MLCPVCGKQNENGAKFCNNCGNRLEAQTPSATPVQDNTDAVASFSNDLDGFGSNGEITIDNTEHVYRNTENRLFLDDDDEEYTISDEAIVSQFFDNLDSLEEDESMGLTTEFRPETNGLRKAAPVFEEIPEEEPPEPTLEQEETTTSYDDYSDIVVGGRLPTPKGSVEKPTIETNEPTIPEPSILDLFSDELESVEEDVPHILIDERPEFEQQEVPNAGDYNVNINSQNASYTPYLDSFVQKPSVNVDFDAPQATGQNNNSGLSHTPPQQYSTSTPYTYNSQQQYNTQRQCQSNSNPQQHIPQQNNPMPSATPTQYNPTNTQQYRTTQNTQQTYKTTPAKTPTQSKKKKTGLIATLVVIGILVIGIATTGFLMRDTISGWFKPVDTPVDNPSTSDIPNISEPPIVEPPVTSEPDTSEPDVSEPDTSEPDVSESDTSEPDIPDVPPIIDNNPNWELKNNSALDAPLIAGEATLVSKYIDDLKTYENLQVKVSGIIRGDDALAIAQNYENQTTVRFEKPATGIEYVVIEYQVYIPVELETRSTTANLPIEIRGLNTNGVVHNNVSYIISTWCIEDAENSSAGSLVTCREIFQMPIDCSNYYIVFGTQGQTTAVYRGE